VRGLLNTPFDLNSSINNQQSDIARSLLDPTWNQRENALERPSSANQGVQQGSRLTPMRCAISGCSATTHTTPRFWRVAVRLPRKLLRSAISRSMKSLRC
jgi:hypothetical protein